MEMTEDGRFRAKLSHITDGDRHVGTHTLRHKRATLCLPRPRLLAVPRWGDQRQWTISDWDGERRYVNINPSFGLWTLCSFLPAWNQNQPAKTRMWLATEMFHHLKTFLFFSAVALVRIMQFAACEYVFEKLKKAHLSLKIRIGV